MAGLLKRGKTYYALYYVGKKQKRVSLETDSLQVAKEKIRQIETSIYRGNDHHLPTKTPFADVVTAYIENMKTRKTTASVIRDVSFLRETFGPICPALALKNAKNSELRKKSSTKNTPSYLEAACIEAVTTAQISNFIAEQVRCKGLKPKTANRYREVLTRLYNWGMGQNGIRIAGDKNPAAKVERYREGAPIISFLTLDQIEMQLRALKEDPGLQRCTATLIYAGIRREELCWLRVEDLDFSGGGNGMLRIRAKTVDGEFWEPKTKLNRVVPISRTLKKYLDGFTPSGVECGWLFPSPTGLRYDPDNFSRALRKANKKGGLKWSCLDFRHTFGSQLAMRGESLYKISALMGNSPEVCRRHYAALLPESLVACVEFGVQTDQPPQTAPIAKMSEVQEHQRLKLVVSNR